MPKKKAVAKRVPKTRPRKETVKQTPRYSSAVVLDAVGINGAKASSTVLPDPDGYGFKAYSLLPEAMPRFYVENLLPTRADLFGQRVSRSAGLIAFDYSIVRSLADDRTYIFKASATTNDGEPLTWEALA